MSIWIDANGDRIKDDVETYSSGCAADFSNYGAWVEIVAPGDSIYSTTPVNYPFYMNYYQGISSGYDWLGGTSMATPHVAAAAARAWSLDIYATNAEIEQLLIDTGEPLDYYLMTDGYDFVGNGITFDPDYAYYNPTDYTPPGYGSPIYYGESFDNDGDGYNDTIMAPYCWPDASGPFDASHDMSNAVMLNVAAAMDRGALWAEVTDANTGLPLTGAKVTAVDPWTNVTKGKSYMTSTTTRFVDIINLPAGYYYNLKVAKSGYTYGSQTFAWYNYSIPGWTVGFSDRMVGVPPKKEFSVVGNWRSGYDLDLFLFLPTSAPNGGGVVGGWSSGHGSLDLYEGNLYEYPYAFFNREGGWNDYLGLESIAVRKGYLASPYYPGTYSVLLKGYNIGNDLHDADPTVRVWYNGRNMAQIYMTDIPDPGEEWWSALQFERIGGSTLYTPIDVCGTGTTGAGGVWPYAESSAIFGSFGP